MTKTETKLAKGEEDEQVSALRESIRHSFPAVPYGGEITYSDGEWTPEPDEAKDLYEALNGRNWPEVPREIIFNLPSGYELLTDQAFVAFLAAWLMASLENMNYENEVRDFLVYAFSPLPNRTQDLTERKMRRIRCLNSNQRTALHSLLAEFVKRGTVDFVRDLAVKGVALIDSIA